MDIYTEENDTEPSEIVEDMCNDDKEPNELIVEKTWNDERQS